MGCSVVPADFCIQTCSVTLDYSPFYYYINTSVNRVLPREVAQAVKGSNDTRFYGVGSGDVGKELPRNKSVLCVLLWVNSP